MLSKLRALAFEINDMCCLGHFHSQCPRNAERFRGLDDTSAMTIGDMAAFARFCKDKHGFQGKIQVHYYNEPLATRARLLRLVEALPEFKFILWTNGVHLTNTDLANGFLDKFSEVMITIYYMNPVSAKFCLDLRTAYPQVDVQRANMDDRKNEELEPVFNPLITSCERMPYWEINFDYYGNGHICCGDWRGEINIGNIKKDDYDDILNKWRPISFALSQGWNEKTFDKIPNVCKLCTTRTHDMSRLGDRRIV